MLRLPGSRNARFRLVAALFAVMVLFTPTVAQAAPLEYNVANSPYHYCDVLTDKDTSYGNGALRATAIT
jgi:hypothetical protein